MYWLPEGGLPALRTYVAGLRAELGELTAKGKGGFENKRAHSIMKEIEAIEESWAGKGL